MRAARSRRLAKWFSPAHVAHTACRDATDFAAVDHVMEERPRSRVAADGAAPRRSDRQRTVGACADRGAGLGGAAGAGRSAGSEFLVMHLLFERLQLCDL